ncbi:immunoglobulin-like domain-containing protein [Paenibacillus alginolyticus]|uniref:DUF5011 domain-containing protein n=1 Tax=Paenibacillus alginolyticus TaxID=59839 RepID=A0ABT4GA60_9BACL|nr:immunoglobulin-like domain-containing protein [Paenibacillus alginolyticus]MCY9693042.1 DUF5011 domain-containing protein [Paenibacillus alginolyticus]MEC0146166.1 DUF5011 domain-containing protein [Paenibacillus alginolyticus]
MAAGSGAVGMIAPTIQTSSTGWTYGPVTFTLSGSTVPESGVQKYQYKLGAGGEWMDYSGSAVLVDVEGETQVYARALDHEGHISPESSAVVRIYRGTPSLTLLGDATMTLEAGSVYADPGVVASDALEGSISSRVVVTGTVDPSHLGTYEVQYAVTNSVGMSATATRTVVVQDTSKPVITLLGDNPAVVPVGGTYQDAGAVAQDAYEGNVTSRMTVTSNVYVSRAGTYTVRYNVADSSGNTAVESVRTVQVVDRGQPYIVLNGANPLDWQAGTPYVDPGASAYDGEDGDLTGSMTVSQSVYANRPGTYSVVYQVSDRSGNAAQEAVRVVNVVDTTPPVVTLLGDSTVTLAYGAPFADPGATAHDTLEGDLTASIVVTGTVDNHRAGEYTLQYRVSDSSGNASLIAMRTVRVLEQVLPGGSDRTSPTAPTIQTGVAGWTYGPVSFTLSGSTDLESGVQKYQYKLGAGGEWTDYPGSVVTVDAEGESQVFARALDHAGNISPESSAVVRIYRGTPSLTLLGDATMPLEAGSVYADPGVVASDALEGSISSRVVVTGTVDPSHLGTYEVKYAVTNSVGMSVTATRTVVVQDTAKPVITLLGDNPAVVPVGGTYQDAGAVAQDAYEGNVTSRMTVTSNVDTSRAGTYTVRYNVADSSGNMAVEAVRTVHVQESPTIPVSPPGPVVNVPAPPPAPQAPSTVIQIPAEPGEVVRGVLSGYLDIQIPSGAIPAGAEIRMAVSSDPLARQTVPASGKLTSEIIDMTSSAGSQISEPVSVTIHYSAEKVPPGQQPALYYYHVEQQRWIYVGGQVTEAGTLQAEMNHFSQVAVIAKPPVVFKDMSGHWAETETKRLAGMEVISGMEEGVYAPGATVTRAQFVVMLSKTFGLQSAPAPAIKDDERIPSWAKPHIVAAVEKGWIQGYQEGDALQFLPDQGMTRAELAVLMERIMNSYQQGAPSDSAIKRYEDQSSLPGWADSAIHRMTESRLMQGYEDGKFHPERQVTRAEAAVLLYRLLEQLHM